MIRRFIYQWFGLHSILMLTWFTNFSFTLKAQTLCTEENFTPTNKIFKLDQLADECNDTLRLDKYIIIYSRQQCRLTGLDLQGKRKWSINLAKKHTCDLLYFGSTEYARSELKKYDSFIKSSDRLYYGLNARKGKLQYEWLEQF